MANLPNKARSEYVRDIFSRFAESYDLANRWMTWWQDLKWRREVIDRAQLPVGGKLLDIGIGTGDLAIEVIKRDATSLIVGIDFSPEMIRIGRLREGGDGIFWFEGDALELPFASGAFDAVVSGYVLRNVIDVHQSLVQQFRVLKEGGTMVCLDTTPPPTDFWHLPVWIYLRWILPLIGGLIAGDIKTYRYLPESTNNFLKATELADLMESVGFRNVGFRCFMGDCMAIHWGVK